MPEDHSEIWKVIAHLEARCNDLPVSDEISRLKEKLKNVIGFPENLEIKYWKW